MPSDTTHATGDAETSSRRTNSFEGIRTASVNGATLAYREQGEGEPVVFVHGSADDLRSWDQQLPAIGASYRAIAYSRRYARPNEDIAPGVDDQTLPHVDDLVAFLRVMGAAPAHLVGHSWGGLISLVAAIRHPQVVRSLVLQEPPVLSLVMSVPPRSRELLRLLVRRPGTAFVILSFAVKTWTPTQKAFRRGDDEAAMQTFGCGLLGKETYERLPQERKQQAFENVRAVRAQVLGAGFPPLNEEDVRGVQAPTLLMTGERSPPYLPRLTDRLQQQLPKAERVKIAAASHLMNEENPGAVNDAILGFAGHVPSVRSHDPQEASNAPISR